jgi:hypothetical protein
LHYAKIDLKGSRLKPDCNEMNCIMPKLRGSRLKPDCNEHKSLLQQILYLLKQFPLTKRQFSAKKQLAKPDCNELIGKKAHN